MVEAQSRRMPTDIFITGATGYIGSEALLAPATLFASRAASARADSIEPLRVASEGSGISASIRETRAAALLSETSTGACDHGVTTKGARA